MAWHDGWMVGTTLQLPYNHQQAGTPGWGLPHFQTGKVSQNLAISVGVDLVMSQIISTIAKAASTCCSFVYTKLLLVLNYLDSNHILYLPCFWLLVMVNICNSSSFIVLKNFPWLYKFKVILNGMILKYNYNGTFVLTGIFGAAYLQIPQFTWRF